jgi:hypothetical protein
VPTGRRRVGQLHQPEELQRTHGRLAHLHVYAIDAAGNTSPIATSSPTWTVDATWLTIDPTFPAISGYYNNTTYDAGCTPGTGDICGTASNASKVEIYVWRQSGSTYLNSTGTAFDSGAPNWLLATGTTSWRYALAAATFPADGIYIVYVRATDAIGNTNTVSATFYIDRTPPVAPTITSGASGTTGPNLWIFFTGEASATFECHLDLGTWANCTNPNLYTELTDGSHTFDVRAIDLAGNTGPITSATWIVDASPPVIGSTFPAYSADYQSTTFDAACGTSGVRDVCGTASDAHSVVTSVEIAVRRESTGKWLTGGAFTAGSETFTTAVGTTSWKAALAAVTLPDDTYLLWVRATDAIGYQTAAFTYFDIDNTPPSAPTIASAGFTTTNAGTSGKLDLADTFTLTYSETMAPASIIAGWLGAGPQNVVVKVAANDTLTIWNETGPQLSLGSVSLNGNYVTADTTFGAPGTPSTLTWNGTSGFTVKLGTPTGSLAGSAVGRTDASWTPSPGATDAAGNAALPNVRTQTDNLKDF